MTGSVLFVWEACRAFSCVWLAPCGFQSTQEESKLGHKGLGWWDKGQHMISQRTTYDISDYGHCEVRQSSPWRLVCRWLGTECVDRCQPLSNQSGTGETQNSAGGSLLAATRKRHPKYPPSQTGCHGKDHQFISSVARQNATHENRLCTCTIGYRALWLGEHECIPRQPMKCLSEGG